ncbi:WG repeat-containing protein [Bacillus sp. 1P02SD]|uniref:WG repeat-containing protein n=1 Tax=Bacillus sp. 1P02SD TaxID=3132264 RepID=UPI0039A1ECD9
MSFLPFKNCNGKYGYRDQQGNIVINPEYKKANSFYNGVALVLKDKFFFINKKNERITEDYIYATNFTANGLALVRKENDNFYYINTNGKKVISVPNPYKSRRLLVPKPFVGSYAPLYYEYNYNLFISENGELLNPSLHFPLNSNEEFLGFSDGIARLRYQPRVKKGLLYRIKYIDTDLNEISSDHLFGLDFKNGVAGVSNPDRLHKDKKGFIDKKGNFVIKPSYYRVNSFIDEGIATVKEGPFSIWKFIDKSNKTVLTLPKSITDVKEYSEGLCPVKRMGFWGYMDTSGDIIIPAESRAVEPFDNGIAKIVHKFGISYINIEGERVSGDKLPY